ncbi:hypothetical protein GW17_00058366, partial [Ensete ventricosum]
ATLVEIKKSFRNVDNVLYDWTDNPSSDHCSWRGVICDNFSNLSGLNLDGEISPAIGNLKALVSIDLKANRLSGQIPDEIGACSSLKVLNLSSNRLNGSIPIELSRISNLDTLNVSYNSFVGDVPTGNNFSRFSPDRYKLIQGNYYSVFTVLCAAASVSKAAIWGIALGALLILLVVLVAACRPHKPPPFPDGSINKPGSQWNIY